MGQGRLAGFVVWILLVLHCVSVEAADDAYVRREGERFILGTSRVQRTLALREGKLMLAGFQDRSTGRELLPGDAGVEEFSLLVGAGRVPLGGAAGGWKLIESREARLAQGELRLDLILERQALCITRSYILYPGSSIIREAMSIANVGDAPVAIADPSFLCVAAALGSLDALDFHWMTGAHNIPGLWTLKTEKLVAGQPRRFDSYDPYPHGPAGQRPSFKPGTASYAPWYAFLHRGTGQGMFIGFDYFGHWASRIEVNPDGQAAVRLGLAGWSRELRPGQSVTTPWAFTGLFRDDLDNAGNELLDWQYAWLWDQTRDGRNGTYPWFPALRHLGHWSKGTGWGKPGVGWTGGNPDMPSLFRKVFRVADYMRWTGADVYHRDWGWWDMAGEWNGPDFRATGNYLRKHGMGQLIYAFLYTVHKDSRIAREHPKWLARDDDGGKTLDMSIPQVVQLIEGQLDSFVARWGDFGWRNDSTLTGQRDADPSTLLEQDQNFRRILARFLDKYPNCGFQAVNGGGNFAGYDYVRYACNVQFSDGVIGPLRNYYSALLFPPDKNCDNPDQWNVDKFDKATWRGLLCFNFDTTGDTIDPAKLEGMRELNDIYHYLHAQGVVGRWVRVYRPIVSGDDPTMWFQRLSRDGRRGIIIPKQVPAGPVTVRPKGLLPDERYVVSFHESGESEQRTGAELMAKGIRLSKMLPGELIYLNLPLHPGSKLDTTPPAAPKPLALRPAENMGYPGVELTWQAGVDDNWVSHYELFRDGTMIEKIAKGTYCFDHSGGADPRARYEIRTIDGAGNASPNAAFEVAAGRRAMVIDDRDASMRFSGDWKRIEQFPAHARTLSAAREKGAAIEFAVEGRRALIFAKLGADCGRFTVSIDGGKPQVVDTFSADDIWGICVWRGELPDAGKHTLRIEVLGQHSTLSAGDAVHIDGVRVERE